MVIRVLVDRLWPRGIKNRRWSMMNGIKCITPSTELRKAFRGIDFNHFARQYRAELAQQHITKANGWRILPTPAANVAMRR